MLKYKNKVSRAVYTHARFKVIRISKLANHTDVVDYVRYTGVRPFPSALCGVLSRC